MDVIEEPGEHLDPTAEITLEAVKNKAVRGVVVLTGRTFFLSLLSLVATGLLTVFLGPDEFGVFFIVSAVVNFIAYFSDVGLAAALIQKKSKLTSDDLRTTFTVQQVLVFSLLVLLVLLTPLFANIYELDREDVFLMYALGAGLLMSSFKTIPSVLLERELAFEKLVVPQVLEMLVYNFVAVILAWQGFGVRSFAYAVLARGLVGLVSIYLIRPWRPSFGLYKPALTKLLRFGAPYQANTLLAVVKDDGMTIVLGTILGTTGVGLLGWAQRWGQAPLRFFMDQVIKVTFPAFSRMQDKKEELSRSVTKSIFFICFLVYPSLVGLLVLAPILVQVIPKYEKWAPALMALGLIGISTVFAAVSTQLTNVLNSIGRIKTTFKLMTMWTVLTWMFVPFLAIRYGFTGAALGYAIVSSFSIVAMIVVKRYVDYSIKDSAMKPLLSSFVMGVVLYLIGTRMPLNVVTVVVLFTLGVVIYISMMYLLVGQSIKQDVQKGLKLLFNR